MALKKCHECGGQVSTEANSCPACGAKVKTFRIGRFLIGAAILAALVKCGLFLNEKPEKKAEPTAEQVLNQARFNHDVILVNALKKSLNNPDSFKLVEALRMDDDTLCITYRATNEYNAIMTNEVALLKDGTIGKWNSVCAGKTGKVVTYIRQAIK